MPHRHPSPRRLAAVVAAASLAAAGCEHNPVVDRSPTTTRLERLPRRKGPRPVVTVYEFRSAVPAVSGAGATDMFTTALIKSGAFAVAERQRLGDGVAREKQLNQAELTTGSTASVKLAGARYIFEGNLTEMNAERSGHEGAISVGGMTVNGRTGTASLGLDVRVVDADTGLVLDAVNVRKVLDQSSVGVGNLGQLAQSVQVLRGAAAIPLNPDASIARSRKDGLEEAVRACMEAAVYELVRRFAED